jgi:hypothetical protein
MPQECPTVIAQYRPAGSNPNGLKGAALVAPLYLCLIAGTGGVYTPQNVQSFFAGHQNPIVEVRGYHKKRDEIVSIAHHIGDIRQMFGMTMTEIAQTFRVTRQAAYSWLNGVEPRPEIRTEICRLGKHASAFREAGIQTANKVARRPLQDGRTLVERITAGENVEDVLPSVKSAALQNGEQPKGRPMMVGSQARKVSLDEISTPILASQESDS